MALLVLNGFSEAMFRPWLLLGSMTMINISLIWWVYLDSLARQQVKDVAMEGKMQELATEIKALRDEASGQFTVASLERSALRRASELLNETRTESLARGRETQARVQELHDHLLNQTLRRQFQRTYRALRGRVMEDVRLLQRPPDCNATRYLQCYVAHRECGFGCQVHTLVDCMVTALLHRRTAVLLPPRLYKYGPSCGSRGDCFFEPLSPCQGHAEAVPPGVWKRISEGSGWQYAAYVGEEDGYRIPEYLQPLQAPAFRDTLRDSKPSAACLLAGVILRHILRPNPRLQLALQVRRQELGLETPVDVGVHVRRTDKIKEEAGYYDSRFYVMHVNRFAHRDYYHSTYGRRYDHRILVVSDEDLGRQVEEFSAYPTARSYPRHDRWEREGLDDFLCDVLLLAEAEYFVGTLSSEVGRMILELKAAAEAGDSAYDRTASLDAGYWKHNQERYSPPLYTPPSPSPRTLTPFTRPSAPPQAPRPLNNETKRVGLARLVQIAR